MSNAIQKLNEQVSQLKKIRVEIEAATFGLQETKRKRDELQANLLECLQKENLKGWKTEELVVSRAVRKSIDITDTEVFLADMASQGFKDHIEVRPSFQFKNTLLPRLIKGGYKFKGAELLDKEYLSIRKPADKK